MRLAIVSLLVLVASTTLAEENDGFKPLFDGKSLAGWEVRPDLPNKPAAPDEWTVKDGMIVANKGASWLRTQDQYGDFVLRVEWRLPVNGNSGVFLRVPELKAGERPHLKGIEIQILDDAGPEYAGKLQAYQYSGSIYGAVPAKSTKHKGAGEWNTYEITCKGDTITVVFNGEKVAEGNMSELAELKDRPRRGYIGLQNHSTPVEFRKVEIKELK